MSVADLPKRFVCRKHKLRFRGLLYLWNYENNRCSLGPTSLCVCNPSIAELPRLKTFISVNFQLFDQNSALLQRCIYFSSLNSPPSFFSSSWFVRFLFRLNVKRYYVWCDTIQFEKVGLWVVTKETDAVLKALCFPSCHISFLSIFSFLFVFHSLLLQIDTKMSVKCNCLFIYKKPFVDWKKEI